MRRFVVSAVRRARLLAMPAKPVLMVIELLEMASVVQDQ